MVSKRTVAALDLASALYIDKTMRDTYMSPSKVDSKTEHGLYYQRLRRIVEGEKGDVLFAEVAAVAKACDVDAHDVVGAVLDLAKYIEGDDTLPDITMPEAKDAKARGKARAALLTLIKERSYYLDVWAKKGRERAVFGPPVRSGMYVEDGRVFDFDVYATERHHG